MTPLFSGVFWDVQQIFLPDIEQVEVIRGPQGSALYGTDAISGVVNIVTRHDGASSDGERASVRTTAGVTQSAFSHNVLSQQHAVSFLSDDILRLRYVSIGGQLRKMMVVVKMRRGPHSIDMHEFEITSEGLAESAPGGPR